jgi:hypothetical protein
LEIGKIASRKRVSLSIFWGKVANAITQANFHPPAIDAKVFYEEEFNISF